MTMPNIPRRIVIAGAAVIALTACDSSVLDVVNPNAATVEGASADPTAFTLLATGLQVGQRNQRAGFIGTVGRLGREAYIYTPQEGRNTTHYIVGITVAGNQRLDPTGFAAGTWAGQYGVLRDVFNFKASVAASASISTAQKSAALGFARTIEALMLFDVVQTHDSLGAIVEIRENASDLAPFVSRDSVYKYILGTLDQALANLAAGGTAFPFTLHSGYTGFNTPTTFARFAQGVKGKVAAHYATAGGGTAAWATSLTAINASFINPAATTRAAFDAGVYVTYAASPDAPNPLTQATNTDLYAHATILADAQLKAGGAPDDRYTAKIRTGLPSRQGPIVNSLPTSAPSTLGFSIWPTITSSIPVLRNEELILLRAEAKLGTGDKAGAIADLNIVRTNSGGLPASTLTAASTNDEVINGILYEKRYSLLMEGNRWVDHRRYGKLGLLTLDVPSGVNRNFVARVIPIPQTECLVRAGKTGDLLGPGGLNNCS